MGLENEEGVTDFTLAGGLPKAASSAQFDIEVQQGDTIYKMSRVLGIPVEKLVEANGGKEEVFANTTIRLPDNIISDISNAKSEVQSPLLSDRAANALKLYPQLGGMLSKTTSVDPEVTDEALERQYKQKAREKEMAAIAADVVATPEVEEVQEQEAAVVQTEAALSKDATPEVEESLTGWSNLAGSESTTLHVDEAKIITMGWGVVPDGGVKVNGELVSPKDSATHKLTSESTLDKVDTSGAYKTVNGVTYKRKDYDSDEGFSKAIYSGFYMSAKSKVKDFDKLTATGKEVIVDFGYNGGEGFFNFNDTATLVTELLKPEADRDIEELTKFTQNFSTQGVGNTAGVLRRRAVMANKVLGSADQIAYIEQTKLANNNTIFSMKRADGTEVNKWIKLEKYTPDGPVGLPVLTIEGQRMGKYIAPKQAALDLTDWAGAIV
tara:strand:- start:43 stop:1356 length:1314 start_codon:yes stop_codon:yes gene_type:complete